MEPVPEGERAGDGPSDVETVGIVKDALVAVSGGPEKHHRVAGCEPLAMEFETSANAPHRHLCGHVET